MPLYHFNVVDGISAPSVKILNLPNSEAAKDQAVTFTGEMLKVIDGSFWDESHWRLDVTDERGLILNTIMVQGVESAASRTLRS